MNNYPQKKSKLFVILIIVGVVLTLAIASLATVIYFKNDSKTKVSKDTSKQEDFKGTVLTFVAQKSQDSQEADIHPYAEAIRTSLQARGYTDCIVVENKDKIIVHMPGVFDYPDAEELAKKPVLKFKDTKGNVLLTGDSIKEAVAEYTTISQGSKGNIVTIRFTPEGAKLFEEATRKVSEMPPSENIIAIYLDDNIISSPAVNAPITGDECCIQGDFTEQTAQTFAAQITLASLNYEIKLEKHEVFSK